MPIPYSIRAVPLQLVLMLHYTVPPKQQVSTTQDILTDHKCPVQLTSQGDIDSISMSTSVHQPRGWVYLDIALDRGSSSLLIMAIALFNRI